MTRKKGHIKELHPGSAIVNWIKDKASDYEDWRTSGGDQPSRNPDGSLAPHRPGSLAPRPVQGPRPIQGPHLLPGVTVKHPKPLKPSKPSSRPVSSGGTRGASSPSVPSRGVTGPANGTPSRTVRRPRTFTDAHGNVRRVRTGTTRSAKQATGVPAKDPIASLVDEIIAGQNLPLENDKKTLTEQSIGNINQTNRLGDFYNQQVGGLRNDAKLDLGAALQRAAELKGLSASTIAANQDYLRSLMGESHGGTQDQQVAASSADTQGQLASMNDGIARDIAGQGTDINDWLVKQQAIARTQQGESNAQELARRSAGIREIDRAKAENAAKRPEMLYQMQQQAADQQLKQQVAEAEWGLKTAQAQSMDAYRQGQLALGAQRNAISAANASKPPKGEEPGLYGNLPKRYNTVVKQVYDQVHKNESATPWRTTFALLTEKAGVPANAAAALATKWWPDSIGAEKSNPFNVIVLLRKRGVSDAMQKRIVDNAYGRGTYDKVRRNPAGTLGSSIGN